MLLKSEQTRNSLILNISVISLLITTLVLLLLSTNVLAAGPTAPAWNIIQNKSRLGFTATYSGTEFDGKFGKFTAKILFDPKHPEDSSFNVNIDTTSITTYSSERDSIIGDSDWFDFNQFPTSTYITKSIKAVSGDKYVAVGTLNLKGHKKDVVLHFTWDEYPNGNVKVVGEARMTAGANIKRTDFGIGSGTYADDDTIGFGVKVKVNLLLKKAGG